MATKLYLNTTQLIAHPTLSGTLSAVFPAGTDKTSTDSVAAGVFDMTATATGTQTSKTSTTGTVAALTSARVNTWVSQTLAPQTIAAATWTLGLAGLESSTNANYFVAGSIYVLTAAGTVRGYIYDSVTQLGTEFTTAEQGRVVTVSGNAVVCQAGDQLVFEWWNTGTQTGTTSLTITSDWGGTTDPVNSSSATSAASYISNPNTISFMFVQINSAVPASGSPVTCTYTSAQTAGNTNIVAVGWSDITHTVSSVADTSGNLYKLAAPLTTNASGFSQAIYYAANIIAASASGNTVTVTFSASVSFPDIRITEYAGLDVSAPFDATASSSGASSGTVATVGPVATAYPIELLFVAGYTDSAFTSAGTGLTQRLITADGNIAEDEVVQAKGSYSPTANITTTTQSVFQVVAFAALGQKPLPGHNINRAPMIRASTF